MFRTPMITALLWAALAIPAAAAGVLYDCDLNAKRTMGWVSPKLAIFIDAKGGTQVIDGAILHYMGAPVTARMRQRGDVARITWNISGATDVNHNTVPTLAYEALLNVKTKAISVVAKPVGYPQRFSAKGVCVIRKNFKGFKRN